MGRKRVSYITKLGLKPVKKGDPQSHLKRVKILERNLKAGRYEGELRKRAVYYKNWYAFHAKRMKSAKKAA